jgi:hemerythrin-like metal-binding protein
VILSELLLRGKKVEDLSWKNEYSVGVEKLDQQHRQILVLMNGIISRPAADPTVASETLTALFKYAEEHFTYEEKLMHDYAYPETAEHEKEHKDFCKKVAQFSLSASKADQSITTDILDFLAKWLVLHILRCDMKYKDFFVARFSTLSASHALK